MLTRNALQKTCYNTSHNALRFGHQLRCTSFSKTSALFSPTLIQNGKQNNSKEAEHNNLVLGLRKSRPPDSATSSNMRRGRPPKRNPDEEVEISDAEWEIRTERALFVLQETLPEFFQIGLVTNVDKSTGVPIRTSILPLSLVPGPNQKFPSHEEPTNAGVEPVYSPRVKLEYTPSALPTPFPRVLHVEGFPLYLASASFLHHTMNALYSDLVVTLMKISFNSLPSSTNKDVPSSGSLSKELGLLDKKRHLREKRLLVRFMVTGNARMSGGINEWEVESTYIFSPSSGLIHKQIINSIHPTPHQAVYDSLNKFLDLG